MKILNCVQIKPLLLDSNTWNDLTVWKQMTNVKLNFLRYITILEVCVQTNE